MAIDVSTLTWGGKEPQNPAEVILKDIAADPALTSLGFKIEEDIQSKKKMYSATMADKITKKRVGCGNTVTGGGPAFAEKFLTVSDLEIFLTFCGADFDNTVFEQARKKGYDINNLEGTQLETLIRDLVTPAAARDLLRIAFFADTASADPNYNQIDAIWKRLFGGVADGDIKRIATLADNAMDAADAAKALLTSAYFGADRKLKSTASNMKRFLVTGSIYENYLRSLISNNALESSWTTMQNGIEVASFMGVPVVPIYMQDEVIAADFSPGGNPVSPHRLIYSRDENIQIGTDMLTDTASVEFWYNRDEDMDKLRIRYKLGTGYVDGDYTTVAY